MVSSIVQEYGKQGRQNREGAAQDERVGVHAFQGVRVQERESRQKRATVAKAG
jgi:hypothetical protein